MSKKLLIVNNIPTPYRAYMYKTMYDIGSKYDINVEVAFLAKKEPHRFWNPEYMDMDFPYWYSSGLRTEYNEYFTRKVIGIDIIKKIRSGVYDYVLAAPAQSIANWGISLVSSKKNSTKKILYSEVNKFSAKKHFGWRRWFRGILYNQFDAIITPGRLAHEFIIDTKKGMIKKPYLFFPNVVDPLLFNCFSKRTWLLKKKHRSEFSLPQDSVIFLAIGTAECKNGYRLLDAISNLENKKKFKVVVLGDSPNRNSLIDYATSKNLNNKIVFLGDIEQEYVQKYMLASDVYIHPSYYDCSPLSCVEASFSGLPLLISRQTGNCRELIIENINGYIFDAYNVSEISLLIDKVLDTETDELLEMGKRSNELALKEFDAKKLSHTFCKWLLSLE